MKRRVLALQRADDDVRHITRWIAQRSPQGANAWLDAYERMFVRLGTQADSCAAAEENEDCKLSLQQALFGTSGGAIYRAVFTIVGGEVRILRVRGPGQPPLAIDELL